MSDQLSPGCKLIINTGSGSTVTGVLHALDEALGKVVLKRGKSNNITASGSRLCGLQNFYFSDMTKLQVIKETPQSSSKRSSLPDSNKRCMDGNDESELPDANADSSLLNVNDEYYETDYYTLIYRLGDKFYEAIDYIMGQEAIGVTFEGVDIGRNGVLSVVQISTETDVIAFDILELGTEAFAEGLQAVFESSNIVKVIHDCRWISDMLHEQFHIRAANIFDTQVANAYVYRILHNGDWPRYVESLPSCLVKHLKLQRQDVTFCKVKDGIQERPRQSPWLQRPLPQQLLSAARRNVSYLGKLHQVLLNKMLYEFRMGVQIYMSHVRNMDGEVESCQKHGYLLPPIFWKIPELVKLTCGDSKGQNDSKDAMGKDLPVPERAFLGFNSVRPKPTEAAGKFYLNQNDTRDWKLQEKNMVRNGYEGNANMTVDHRSDRDHSLADLGFTHDSYFSNGSRKLDPDRLRDKNSHTQKEIVCRNHQDFSLPSLQISESHLRSESQIECDRKEFYKPAADLCSRLDTPEVLMPTDTEQDCLSKTIPDSDTNCRRAMPKLVRVHHNMQSSGNLSETSDCDGTPSRRPPSVDQLHSSHLSRSFHSQSPSSDSESWLARLSTPELSISRGKDLACSSFLPAGFDAVRKKKLTDQKQSHSSDKECETNNQDCLSASLEEDLCYIPMQGSLMCRQERPLGVTSFDFKDPISDSEGNVQSPSNSQFYRDSHLGSQFYTDSHLGSQADNANEQESMDQFQKSEVFQKVLRVASSLPLDNLKSKLLPSKVSLYGK
ncbi:unnamed protein product [Candidula unifasciata]|uniref:3'-5' exonuclease domain-containing protein n=1 Tax=Candidula unifasciata TaxID=100452 RepID=A0A8S3ZII0_9EUPU|nr:unnamed protein product [Candidula unifasciata]